MCGGQTNDIEFDIGDSVVIDFNDSTRSKTVLDQSTNSNKKLQGKSDLISRKCKKKKIIILVKAIKNIKILLTERYGQEREQL